MEAIIESIKKELHEGLSRLCQENIRSLDLVKLCSHEAPVTPALRQLLQSRFFEIQPSNYSYDCHIRPKVYLKIGDETHEETITSRDQFVIAPIPNVRFLYCRGSLSEGTRSKYDEIIPSRDYLLSTYIWKNVFSYNEVEQLKSLLSKSDSYAAEGCVEVFFFGIQDPQRGSKLILKISVLLKAIINTTRFMHYLESERFDFFAIKFLDIDSNCEKNIDVVQASKKRTYAIFIDSLDRTIFEDEEIMKRLPNLKSIHEKSILFERFTSSGFWTFPCLHSMHTGIPPYYGASFLKFPPRMEISFLNSASLEQTLSNKFLYLSYNTSGIKPLKLTTILHQHGIKTAAIKSSTITSCNWGLLEGVDLSIENSTIDMIPTHLANIELVTDGAVDCVFIDIDTLHRGPDFYKSLDVKLNEEELDWLVPKRSKVERLLGDQSNNCFDKRRERSGLIKIDNILGKLLSQISEKDNLIIYSDNGSQAFLSNQEPLNMPLGSSATREKIWQPTLMITHNCFPEISRVKRDMFVSTTDLYATILEICGVDPCEAEKYYRDQNVGQVYDSYSLVSSCPKIRDCALSFGLNWKQPILEMVIRNNKQHYDNATILSAKLDDRELRVDSKNNIPIVSIINHLFPTSDDSN